jgi:thiaminase
MTRSAEELVAEIRRDLTPDEGANRLVPLIEAGTATLPVIAALAAEEHHIVGSDWRSFLALAAKADESNARGFCTALAGGESLVLPMLPPLAAAAGMDGDAFHAYEPQAGCQAYPAYIAWLVCNGEVTDVLLAILANFEAWGGYCARIAAALRAQYGFADEACAFFDFFATPVPELERQAIAAVQASLDAGWHPRRAWRYGRLLQSYELMFWNTLADAAA